MQEYRLFARIKVKFPLKFLDLNTGKEGKAETVDISAGGLGFITKENLTSKTPLEIWIDIPNDGEPFYLKGEVVWTKVLVDTDKEYVGVHLRVGIRFEEAKLVSLGQLLLHDKKIVNYT